MSETKLQRTTRKRLQNLLQLVDNGVTIETEDGDDVGEQELTDGTPGAMLYFFVMQDHSAEQTVCRAVDLGRYLAITEGGEGYWCASFDGLPEVEAFLSDSLQEECACTPVQVLDLDEGTELPFDIRVTVTPKATP